MVEKKGVCPVLLILLFLGFSASPSAVGKTATLCDELFLPEGYGLVCEIEKTADGRAVRAVVRPLDGDLAAFNRLSVRRLRREGADALAWRDPERWLRGQMRIDLSAYAEQLRKLVRDPDSPLSADSLRRTVEMVARVVEGLGNIVLRACDRPARSASGQWLMRCHFGKEPLVMRVEVRLVAKGRERYAFNLRSISARRMRHFEAIANSFSLG